MKTGRKAKGWSRGLLARLACDTAGNTMLMMAAAMIPIIGMAGSAFDMSRAYMVKSRLQQACDAGALAGRRAMTAASFDSDTAAKQQANNFFNFNYPAGSFSTTGVNFTPVGTNDGQVTATARATVPMAIMKMFGVPSITMNVACDARLEIANNDIMFVLDVTGSMSDSLAGKQKIVHLREAVNGFYEVMADNMSTSAQVRYGFVPFSAGINVGQLLLDINRPEHLVDSFDYQTRVANYSTPIYVGVDGTWNQTGNYQYYNNDDYKTTQSNCQAWGQAASVQTGGGPPPTATSHTGYGNDAGTNGNAGPDWGWSGAPDTSGDNRSCRRKTYTFTRTYPNPPRYQFTNWVWKQDSIDTSQYKLGNAVAIATNTGGTVAVAKEYDLVELATAATGVNSSNVSLTTTTSTWNRCIEERDTVPDATFSTVPSNAFDLDISRIPDSQATRWRPNWRDLVYLKDSSNHPSTICPAPARRLSVMTADQVSTYVNGLTPTGNTYLDFGMIWGARLISPTGVFRNDTLTAPNGRQINRHAIFMTDGSMWPEESLYNMYGYEPYDRRITGTSNTQTGNALQETLRQRHLQRFTAICTALRNQNVTVWTISFGVNQEPEMKTCATPGHDLVVDSADGADGLKDSFKEIAKRIAELRLTK